MIQMMLDTIDRFTGCYGLTDGYRNSWRQLHTLAIIMMKDSGTADANDDTDQRLSLMKSMIVTNGYLNAR